MLLEVPGNLSIDGVNYIENLWIKNKKNQNQLRCKFTVIDSGVKHNIDIIIYRYSVSSLKNLDYSISFNGKELNRNKTFNLDITYIPIRGKIKITGEIDSKKIKETLSLDLNNNDKVLELLKMFL